jgi:hypothetical protein
MKSEEYFIKTRNILKILRGNHLRILIVTTIYLVVLFLFSSSAYALNWNDKEWKDAGCPQSAIGLWKFDGSDNKEKTMRIEKGKVAIIAGNNIEEKFLYETISLKVGDKFIELFLNSIDHVKKIFLKIRPHLISPIRKSLGDVNKNSYNCLIKVFQYSSPINAKFDKYSSWKIYKLNNTN